LLALDSSFEGPFEGFVNHGERFVIVKVRLTGLKLNGRLLFSFIVLVFQLENFDLSNATIALTPTPSSGAGSCNFSLTRWNRDVNSSGRLDCRSEDDTGETPHDRYRRTRLIDVMLNSETTNLCTSPAVAFAAIVDEVFAVVTSRMNAVSIIVDTEIERLDQHLSIPTNVIGSRTRGTVAEDFGSRDDGRHRGCRGAAAEEAIGGGSEHRGGLRIGWVG
jgi:hypothetical protein